MSARNNSNILQSFISATFQQMSEFISDLNILYKVTSECTERFVQFLGCYVASKKVILFTEWMPNQSVKDHITETPLDEATALKYTFQAAQGLYFLHNYQRGVLAHRDVKCKTKLF